MGYRNLAACVADLQATGRLVRIDAEIDPHLEMAEIQRRVYAAGGPALLFTRVKSCQFPMLGNLFGTIERARFIFRDTLDAVSKLVELKVDPAAAQRRPWRYVGTARTLWHMLPKSVGRGPILAHQTKLSALPQLQSWPRDGGAYITLPQVYTEDADKSGWQKSNLGMYRVQLSGKHHTPDEELGLHYQIHRGIGVHHARALAKRQPFRVNIFVGGTPAMTLAAVMPLPEGLSELSFAGALAGHRIPLVRQAAGLPLYGEADFCITGTVTNEQKLEGPFGDHLGYYSLEHPFPVMRVEKVFHREGAIWPFTVVGRPPQEDTVFGELIHEITGPVIPTVIPGLHAVNAVDAAGVHPLLLAIGSERYTPYNERRRPMELLTTANAVLGQGQLSLAKYLLIVAKEDNPSLDIHDIAAFLKHLLERFDPRRDLHFQTCTTIDTLDYSGTGFNEGSKVVVAAVGAKQRELPTEAGDVRLPDGFSEPRVALPGVLVVRGPKFAANGDLARFCQSVSLQDAINRFPLVVLADDSEFTARNLNNLLWVTFTRSNPASDIDGIGSFTRDKHWGCEGSVVIDARIKPQHAPPLEEDSAISRRVDTLAARGGPLHGII
jgi:4-hydroxy-3-polyprenylbenzoate decarboxylase